MKSSSTESLAQALSQIIHFLGGGKATGKAFAAVVLNPNPLDLETLEVRAGISRGSAHSAIKKLIASGLVRKTWQKGNRKECFEPTGEVLNGFTRLAQQKIWNELDPAWAEWKRTQQDLKPRLDEETNNRLFQLDRSLGLIYQGFKDLPEKIKAEGEADA